MNKFDEQLSSPESHRKMASRLSVILMLVAWLFFTGCLIWLIVAGAFADLASWSPMMFLIVGVLGLGFVLAPIQLVRYFRH